jgi:starch phosphorylase
MAKTKKTSASQSTELSPAAGTRCGLSVADLKQSFLDNLLCALGRVPMAATRHDIYAALALTVRDRLFKQSVSTMENYAARDARVVASLSAEFLPGASGQQPSQPRHRQADSAGAGRLDVNLDVIEQEEEPGWAAGTGAVGVVLSGFAHLRRKCPPSSYGIRYGSVFSSDDQDGWQIDPDKWLRFGNPWKCGRKSL